MRVFVKSVFLICLLFSFSVAAKVKFVAEIDPAEITLEDSATITLNIETNGSIEQLTKPYVAGLSFVESGQTSHIQSINGSLTVKKIFYFRVVADEPGTYRIPPFELSAGGQSYNSNPLSLSVKKKIFAKPPKMPFGNPVQPGQTPQNPNTPQIPAQNLPGVWVTAAVDKTEIYEQEPILFRVKLYTRKVLSNIELDMPEMNEFLFEMLEKSRQGREVVNGETYNTVQQTYALIPLKSGKLTMPSVKVDVTIQEPVQSQKQGGNFYFQFNTTRSVNKTLSAAPIELNIKPLPQPIPANFTGLVGDFGLQVSANPKTLKKGETITMELALSGSGNIKQAILPAYEWPDFKVYADKPQLELVRSVTGLSGKKVFKMALIPLKSGDLKIPQIDLSYFDPTQGEYKTLTSPAVALSVQDAGNAQTRFTTTVQDDPVIESPLPQKTIPVSVSEAEIVSYSTFNWSWILTALSWLLIPCILLLLSLVSKAKKETIKYNKHSSQVFKKMQQKSVEQKEDVKDFLKLLQSYFAKRFSKKAQALTAMDVKLLLNENGFSKASEPIYKAWQVLEGCEYGFVTEVQWKEAVEQIKTSTKEIES